jgi:hypothetical protein
MSKIWTVEGSARSVVDQATLEVDSEPRKAHVDYVAVDPGLVAERLRDAGLHTELAYGSSKKTFLRSPRTAILQVTDRRSPLQSALGEDYVGACHVYFDHRGRSSIKLCGGPLRCECANVFTSPDVRIHHCSDSAADFLAHPVSFVLPVIQNANRKLAHLEELRGLPHGNVVPAFVRSVAPRLGAQVEDAFGQYACLGGNNWWAALQALTLPGVRRLDEFAGAILASEINEEAPWLTLNACWN